MFVLILYIWDTAFLMNFYDLMCLAIHYRI